MGACLSALAPLDEAARFRVLDYLAARFGVAAPTIDNDEMLKAAAVWAASVVEQLQAEEIEQAVLSRQGWGDEVGLIEGALPEIAKRLRIIGGAGNGD